MNTPSDLYLQLKNDFSLEDKFLCDLHKPCSNNRKCSTPQENIKLIDFDEAMRKFCSGKTSTKSSVDGLCCENTKILFIEIKGWTDFLEHNQKNVESKIIKQVNRYNLSDKLLNSILLCQSENNSQTLWEKSEIYYFLITDIDINPKESGLESLASSINFLAQTSNSYEAMCSEYLENALKNQISVFDYSKLRNINKISYYYKKCSDFEKTINNL